MGFILTLFVCQVLAFPFMTSAQVSKTPSPNNELSTVATSTQEILNMTKNANLTTSTASSLNMTTNVTHSSNTTLMPSNQTAAAVLNTTLATSSSNDSASNSTKPTTQAAVMPTSTEAKHSTSSTTSPPTTSTTSKPTTLINSTTATTSDPATTISSSLSSSTNSTAAQSDNSTQPANATDSNSTATTVTSPTPTTTSPFAPSDSPVQNSTASNQTSPSVNVSTTTTPLTTQSTSPVTQPPVPAVHSVKISETNILLGDATKLFIELSGNVNESLTGLFLTLRDANKQDETSGILLFSPLSGNINADGLYILDDSNTLKLKKENMTSVVVALYSDGASARKLTTNSLVDSFLYGIHPANIDAGIAEVYNPLSVNNMSLNLNLTNQSDTSISSCGKKEDHMVWTTASRGKQNDCNFKLSKTLQLKLIRHTKKAVCTVTPLESQFDEQLKAKFISQAGQEECGLTLYNIEGLKVKSNCVDDNREIGALIQVRSAFVGQYECIEQGYNNMISQKETLLIGNYLYKIVDCSGNCFPHTMPATKHDGGSDMKATVAVVVSCIGIFLIILMSVIVYLKKKRRGLLQFRMTRLDEDDDELVGDMDDFVGNQGATFSNFR